MMKKLFMTRWSGALQTIVIIAYGAFSILRAPKIFAGRFRAEEPRGTLISFRRFRLKTDRHDNVPFWTGVRFPLLSPCAPHYGGGKNSIESCSDRFSSGGRCPEK